MQEFQIATNRFTRRDWAARPSSAINVVTQVRRRPAARLGVDLPARSPLAGAAGDLRPIGRRRAALRSPAGRRRRSAARCVAGQAVLVRRGRIPQPGRRRAGRHARRRDAHDLARLRAGAARRSARLGARRLARRRADAVMVRYAGERADDTGASTLDRAIGSASQRQASVNRYQSACWASWTRVARRRDCVNASRASRSARSTTASIRSRPAPQLTFPSLVDGVLVPRAAGHDPEAVRSSPTPARSCAARTRSASAASCSASTAQFDLDVFRAGPHRAVEDFADFDHNGDGRVDDDDLLFAVTLRSGKPDQGSDHRRRRQQRTSRCSSQDDWRVRPRPHAQPRPALRARHRRQEHQPRRRDQPDRAAVPATATRGADLNNFGPRIGFNWAPGSGRTQRARRLRHLLRPHHARDPVARARPRRPGAADRGARRQRVLPRSRDRPVPAVCAVDVEPVHRLHPAGRRRIGHQHHRQRHAEPDGAAVQSRRRARSCQDGVVLRVDGVHNHGTHFIIGRTVGTVFNPVVGGPDRVVNLESSVETQYDALLVERRAARRALGLPRVVHARRRRSTTPTTIRSRSRTARSIRTTSGASTARRRTTSATASRSPAWSICRAGFLVAPLWTLASGVPMDILMPDAQSPRPGVPAQRRRAAVQDRRRAQRVHSAI